MWHFALKAREPATTTALSHLFLLFLFQSSSQTAIFCQFFFYTQDTAMHNSKFKKSIASTTIKNSLSKTSSPRQLTVPHQRWVVGGREERGRGGLLRYARWFSSCCCFFFFTKLDNNNKSNNNNDNNLKSNIFCLCSILLIHINRGFFFLVVVFHTTCTGLHIQKIGMYRSNHRKQQASAVAAVAVSLGPGFTFVLI